MTKLILMFTIAVGLVAYAPAPAAAQDCTASYEKCLNDTWDTSGATRLLADIECFAAYIGCVRGTL
jgi:hypothetical protein